MTIYYLDGRLRCGREVHERRNTFNRSGWQGIRIWIFQRLGRQRTVFTRYSSGYSRIVWKNTQASIFLNILLHPCFVACYACRSVVSRRCQDDVPLFIENGRQIFGEQSARSDVLLHRLPLYSFHGVLVLHRRS